MKSSRAHTSVADGKAILDRLPQLYFTVLKNTQIEATQTGFRCSVDLPVLGRRASERPTAAEAIRAILGEITDALTAPSTLEWPTEWRSLVAELSESDQLNSESHRDRFQSKARQFTLGVTMPVEMKGALQQAADEQEVPFAEIARQVAALGFEDFDERSFAEGSEALINAFLVKLSNYRSIESEQVMLRLDPRLAVRLRSAAKEHRKSGSEFAAMCIAQGLTLRSEFFALESKIDGVRGAAIRPFIRQLGLDTPAPLLSGVLAGSTQAPKKVLRRLSEVLETSESALKMFFKRSFERRALPAFKSAKAKPQVARAPVSWKAAVSALKLSDDEASRLLALDDDRP